MYCFQVIIQAESSCKQNTHVKCSLLDQNFCLSITFEICFGKKGESFFVYAGIEQWGVVCRLVVRVRAAAGAMERSLCLDHILGSVVVWAKEPRGRFQTTSSHCRTWPQYQIGSSPAARAGALAFSLNKDARVLIRTPWLCGKWVLESLSFVFLTVWINYKVGLAVAL